MRHLNIFCLSVLFGAFALSSFAADGPESFKAGEFTFKAPKGWGWVKTTSRMRAIWVGGEREDLRENTGLVGLTMDLSVLRLPLILTIRKDRPTPPRS